LTYHSYDGTNNNTKKKKVNKNFWNFGLHQTAAFDNTYYPMGKQKKSTKRFEKNHLKQTIERRKKNRIAKPNFKKKGHRSGNEPFPKGKKEEVQEDHSSDVEQEDVSDDDGEEVNNK
jgi:hypothetical protein